MGEPGRRLRGVRGEQAITAFQRAGWEIARIAGDHVRLKRRGYPSITIPLHKELKIGTLISAIKLAGMTVEEFESLLRN